MSVDWKDTTQPRRGYVVDHRVLKLGDVDLRGEPLHRRKKLLEKSLPENPRLLYVEHMEPEGLAMFAGALALGLEGVIAKDSKSPTLTWHWQKIKNRDERKEKVEFKQRGEISDLPFDGYAARCRLGPQPDRLQSSPSPTTLTNKSDGMCMPCAARCRRILNTRIMAVKTQMLSHETSK